ncbi:MAG: LamG-like jellyroll fold domain-containing protein [Actinomycetota bacterium]
MNQSIKEIIVKTYRVILIFSFLFFLLSIEIPAQTCTPAPVGLASWWTADGSVLDSRSRNDGTLGLTGFAAGQVGQSFTFNNGFGVMVADNPTLNPQNFTIEAWVTAQPQNFAQGTQIIASKSGSGATFGFELAITPETFGAPDAGVLRFVVRGGTTGDLIDSGHRIVDGNFHHIAATYDGATMIIFLDGTLSAQQSLTTTINYQPNSLFVMGSREAVGFITAYSGLIDEPSFYDRALTQAEIASIFNAGTAGKCKPTATVAPSGLVAWLAGDGNPNDISGNNNGTLNNGASFAVGKVGQGFNLDGIDDTVTAAQPNAITSSFTAEAWINPTSLAANPVIFERSDGTLTNRIGLQILSSGVIGGYMDSSAGFNVSGGIIPINTFTHVIYLFDDAANSARLYVNGVQIASSTETRSPAGSTGTLTIGTSPISPDPDFFAGRIDEFSLYNRALTDAEITSLVNAGVAGKLKTTTTPTGFSDLEFEKFNPQSAIQIPQSVNTPIGDAIVTFPNVITAGTTQEIPLNATLLPALPMGMPTGLTYDIGTSAVFTGNPTVCFNLPSFTAAQFANLRIFHLEAGAWVNRTASGNTFPVLCSAGLTSLSPFGIVQVAPSAANVSVGGRVSDSSDNPVSRARVAITDSNGTTRNAITNTFGFYHFEDVRTGENYTINVLRKGYQFTPRVIFVADAVGDLDFSALP